MLTVTVEGFKRLCKIAARTRQPIIGWGGPGVGKTASPKQAMAELSIETSEPWLCHVLVATDYTLGDFRGLPEYTGEGSERRTRYLPEEGLVPVGGKGLYVVDEMNLCMQEIQNVFRKGLDERRFGGLTVPEGWTFVFLCNRTTDRAGVYDIPAPLISRAANVMVEPDAGEVATYLLRHEGAGYAMVAAFLGWKPAVVNTFDPKLDGPYGCPRTWEKVAQLTGDFDANKDDIQAFTVGLVGDGAAAEYLTFRRLRAEVPDVDGILKGTATPPQPDAIDASVALASVLAERSKSDDQMQAVLNYAAKCLKGEVAAYFAHHLTRQPKWRGFDPGAKRTLLRTAGWRAFVQAHGEVV